ncbi:MAG: hypothetical protein CMJ78_25815 [Planctomycetaceae bacterium]|nr:hypothetical protein [Planctomycetaceae bacterium]
MEFILEDYSVNESTWLVLSSILIVSVFFRFSRMWSLRNLDLLLLLLISPGILLVNGENGYRSLGDVWLFAGSTLLLFRLFFDSLFKRRPILEQNMNKSGLLVLCVATFLFQVTRVMTEPLPETTVATVQEGEKLLNGEDSETEPVSESPVEVDEGEATPGPAQALIGASATLLTNSQLAAARLLAVLAHLAAVCGLYMLGRKRFGDSQLGLAMATLYLLLPCTAYNIGKVHHVLPAALIVWALVTYRRPLVAGSLMGFACGAMFFPVFLLPIWITFYGKKGWVKFCSALAVMMGVILASHVWTSADARSFIEQTVGSIDWSVLKFHGGNTHGFWAQVDEAYRLPVVACFFLLLVLFSCWPLKKNLEHVISHSTAIIVATQLWYPQSGGVYVLWYLPLMLMVVFRPRLTNSVAPEFTESETVVKSTKPGGTTNTDSGRMVTP